MSDPKSFLTRWSRRKRDATDEAGGRDKPSDSQSAETATGGAAETVPAVAELAEPLFDLAKLPSLESITADTDISAFLTPGVPSELKTAALRRAWVADPRIKDFVGLNDYDFDFHTPGAIPGFGSLEMTDELRREVARIVGGLLPEDEPSSGTAVSKPPEPNLPPRQPPEAIEEVNASVPRIEGESETPSPLPVVVEHQPEETQSNFAALQTGNLSVASQQNGTMPENLQSLARRTHGGALPK